MAADVSQDLGSRIVQAARLAVAMHLAQSLSSVDSTGTNNGRTHAIGGAGPRGLTDEQSPSVGRMTGERPRRSTPSTLLDGFGDTAEAA
jgi:hypothetical protein